MPIFLSYPCNRISLNHVLGNINVPLISLITVESVVLSFSVRIRWSVPMTHTHRDRSFIGSVLYKDVNFLRSSTYLPVLFSYSSFPSYPLHLQPLSQHTHTPSSVFSCFKKRLKRERNIPVQPVSLLLFFRSLVEEKWGTSLDWWDSDRDFGHLGSQKTWEVKVHGDGKVLEGKSCHGGWGRWNPGTCAPHHTTKAHIGDLEGDLCHPNLVRLVSAFRWLWNPTNETR